MVFSWLLPFLTAGLLFVAFHALVAWALMVWGRWVARRHPTNAWKHLVKVPWVGAFIVLASWVFGTCSAATSWTAMERSDPSQKATRLAMGISELINCVALAVACAWLVFVAVAVALLYGTLRQPQRSGGPSS